MRKMFNIVSSCQISIFSSCFISVHSTVPIRQVGKQEICKSRNHLLVTFKLLSYFPAKVLAYVHLYH